MHINAFPQNLHSQTLEFALVRDPYAKKIQNNPMLKGISTSLPKLKHESSTMPINFPLLENVFFVRRVRVRSTDKMWWPIEEKLLQKFQAREALGCLVHHRHLVEFVYEIGAETDLNLDLESRTSDLLFFFLTDACSLSVFTSKAADIWNTPISATELS